MRYLAPIGIALAVVISAAAAAQSSDGTWRADLSAVRLPSRPLELVIEGGTYRCISCARPWSVAADGRLHRAESQPYFEEARCCSG